MLELTRINLMKKITAVSFLILFFNLIFPLSSPLAAMQSLNGQSGENQSFVNDSNIQISSTNNLHNLIWNGILSVARGGTGASSFTNGSIPFISNGIFAEDSGSLSWDNLNDLLTIGAANGESGIVTPWGTTGNDSGGSFSIETGAGIGTGFGGSMTLLTGNGGENGSGGPVYILAGSGGLSGGKGGDVEIWAGGAQGGNNNGGDVTFASGNKSGSGTLGTFKFKINPRTDYGILDFSSINTSDKTFTFPNDSGTLTLLQSNQIFSGLNKFEANNNSTIYVGSSTKSGCIALGDSDGSGVTYITANNGVLTASSTKPSICQ